MKGLGIITKIAPDNLLICHMEIIKYLLYYIYSYLSVFARIFN